VLGAASALAIVTSIPYAVGLAADLDGEFAWHLVFEADINAYLGFIRQAEQGAFRFTNPSAPEPHRPVVVNLEWAAVGHFARLAGLSLEAAFHVMRLVFVFVLCGALHWLAGFVLEARLARRPLLLAVATGGGFGWLLAVPVLGAGIYTILGLSREKGRRSALVPGHLFAPPSLLVLASSAQFSTALVVPLALVGMQGRESRLAGVARAGIRGRSLLSLAPGLPAALRGALRARRSRRRVGPRSRHFDGPSRGLSQRGAGRLRARLAVSLLRRPRPPAATPRGRRLRRSATIAAELARTR